MDALLLETAVFLRAHFTETLLQFISLQAKGDRKPANKKSIVKIRRITERTKWAAIGVEWNNAILLVNRIFVGDIFESQVAAKTLNKLQIPFYKWAVGYSTNEDVWHLHSLKVLAILTVLGAWIETPPTETIKIFADPHFTPISGTTESALFVVKVSKPSATTELDTEAKVLVEKIRRLGVVQDEPPKDDDDDSDTPSSARNANAELPNTTMTRTTNPDPLNIIMTRLGDIEKRLREDDSSSSSLSSESAEDESPRKRKRSDLGYDEDLPSEIQALYNMRDSLYRGMELSWGDRGKPQSHQMKNWYPQSNRDQSSFLAMLAQICERSGKTKLLNILLQAIIDINMTKNEPRLGKLPMFTQALFMTLRSGKLLDSPPEVVTAHVFNVIEQGQSSSTYKPNNFNNNYNNNNYRRRRSESRDKRRRSRSRKPHNDRRRNNYRDQREVNQRIHTYIHDFLTRQPTNEIIMRRAIRKVLIDYLRIDNDPSDHPSGSNAQLLLSTYKDIFRAGSTPVDRRCFPDGDMFKSLHQRICFNCHDNCSGIRVSELLKFGWRPTFTHPPAIVHPRVYDFHKCGLSIKREVDILLAAGQLREVAIQETECVVPVKIVVKSEHWQYAGEKLQLRAVECGYLGPDETNKRLEALGHTRIKTRMVADYRAGCFNDSYVDAPFSYVNINVAIAMAYKLADPYFIKLDLKSYYNQLPLAEDCQKYYGIFDGNLFYKYTSVPFGIKHAPILATLISSEIVDMANKLLGITSISYIDDILIVADGLETAINHKERFLDLLKILNVEVNFDKVIGPNKKIEFLGFTIDTNVKPFTMSLNSNKVETIRGKVIAALEKDTLSYTDLSSLCGSLLYASEVVTLGWCHTLPIWRAIKGLSDSQRVYNIILNEYQKSLLRWWKDILSVSQNIQVDTFAPQNISDFDNAIRIYSDASGLDGFGYHSEDLSIVESFAWPVHMIEVEDMLWKELHPFVIFIESHGQRFQGRTIIWLCDNAAAAMTMNGGAARNQESNDCIMRIIVCMRKWKISVFAFWIPRNLNILADYLSHHNLH